MTSRDLTSRYFMFAAAIAVLILSVLQVPPVMAQQQTGAAQATIVIDGSRTPDQIPEWILWHEFFRVAARLSEASPTQGVDHWMERLHLTAGQAELLVSHGKSFMDEEARITEETRSILRAGNNNMSDAARARLYQLQADKENRSLTVRDLLHARIGEDAFNRIQSLARLNIAPGIKVGKQESGR